MRKIITLFLFGICFFLLNVREVRAEIVPFPKPNVNVSPNFNPVDGNNALKLVESTETQGAILEQIEGGAKYGMSQKGYVPNPIVEGMSVAYGAYKALYSLYGEDPEYQAFIQPYQRQDVTPWGTEYTGVNVILGTFTYGEIRLDALIDEKTGDIKASVLSFQSGFEKTVDKFISKVQNNFYCPVKPDFECEEYGLTYPSAAKAYSIYAKEAGKYQGCGFLWFEDGFLDALPDDVYCCFLKNVTSTKISRTLYLVSKEPLSNISYRGESFWTSNHVMANPYLEDPVGMVKTASLRFKGQWSGYYFYSCESLSHDLAYPIWDYYFPYVTFNMNEKDFKAYYVDNAGKLSVGGVLLSPVQPSVKGFPQPGNVYNPSDMQEYNNNQREKIEECPIISPQSEPYPGSVPAPAVEPLPGTHSLPLIITDPATGEMTVKPVELPDPAPGGDKVIDPETGEEVTDKNLSPYMFDLSKKFPFCVPFDLINAVKILKQKPAAPSFDWTLKVDMIGFEYTFHIDLACFEPAAKICRIMFTLLFIVSLVVATRGMIRG